LDAHAQATLAGELKRRQALLDSLPPASRAAVEHTARTAVAAVTAGLLEDAAREPALAAALASIYAVPTAAPAAARAD
jgi:hypothetical protein